MISKACRQIKGLQEFASRRHYTHFASADDLSENEFTNNHIKRFTRLWKFLMKKDSPVYHDLANCPAQSLTRRQEEIWYGLVEFYTDSAVYFTAEIENRTKAGMSLHTRITI